MSVTTAGPGEPAQMPGEAATAAQVWRARLRAAVSARGIPLATILINVAVVALTYLAGKLADRGAQRQGRLRLRSITVGSSEPSTPSAR